MSKELITATELKTNFGKYIDYVMDDHELVVTKNGKRTLRISPYLTDYDRYNRVKESTSAYVYAGKRLSYEEFLTISEGSELRMEFINGEIVVQSAPTVFHQEISGNMHILFRQFLKGKTCKVFYAPFDVTLYKPEIGDPDVCQPDLLIVCDMDKVNDRNRYMGVPALVVEILSPSTRSHDMVLKLNTYMLSGVGEYIVVDPVHKHVIHYVFEDRGLLEMTQLTIDETFESHYFEGLNFKVEEIFEA